MSKNEVSNELVSNRRAHHDYEILETVEAGVILAGTEIKSLRNHGGTLQDSFVDIREGALWLINASIAPYLFGNLHNHEDKRPRKLLLHKREIDRLSRSIKEKGLTIIPLSIYLKKGRAKVKIAIAKGKKNYDKRADLKKKDLDRAMQREGED